MIDSVLSGDRNKFINAVSNALDGIDSKTTPIITIVTSNNPSAINPVNIRPGRISSSIVLTPPNAEAAARFVSRYATNQNGESLLCADFDAVKVGEALAGNVPAFILEAVNRAKGREIYLHGKDIVGKITTEDMLLAVKSLTDHLELMKGQQKTATEVFAENTVAMFEYLVSNSSVIKKLQSELKDISEHVC